MLHFMRLNESRLRVGTLLAGEVDVDCSPAQRGLPESFFKSVMMAAQSYHWIRILKGTMLDFGGEAGIPAQIFCEGALFQNGTRGITKEAADIDSPQGERSLVTSQRGRELPGLAA